ncbi:MAG: helix-turn-helix domain-containing protein [Firmicutes bacterium]|nr:helix-turn-helix domain-containing protein [Bacillota bacterium]
MLSLNEIGVLLRGAREARGMSLADVSEITKIRSKYLDAIERGEFAMIPGEVYLKGFIRNYADCVGLDGGQVVARYNELRLLKEAAALKQLEEERLERLQRNRKEARTRRINGMLRALVWTAMALGAAAGIYYAARALGFVTWNPPWSG